MADNVISKIELPDGSQYSIKDAGAARSNHTHTTTLAEDSTGTSSISLKAGTKYKLTSGGTPYTFTTPADTNDKVTQTATTTSANYEILFSGTADNTNHTEGARKTSTLTYNPSTKDLSTGGKVNGYTLAAASARSVDETIGVSSTSTILPTSKAVATFVEGKGYVTSSGVTQVGTGAGLTGGTITGTGTIKANLTSETKLTNAAADGTETAGRVYPIRLDKDGKLAVNVPWTNSNGNYLTGVTTTGSGNAITAVEKNGQSLTFTKGTTFLTAHRTYTQFTGNPTSNQTPAFGGTFTIQQISQATAGQVSGTDKTVTIPGTIAANDTKGLIKPWRNHTKASTGPTAGSDATAVAVNAISSTAGKYYAVEIDSDGRLFANVPWTDTNTHHQAKLIVGATSTATANAAVTANSIYANVIENSEVRSSNNIVGGGSVTVSSDANGKITITGTKSGTVTSITPGNGLLNGTGTSAITTSGTLNINYGTSASNVNGNGSAAGTANTVSRSDHVHKIEIDEGTNNGEISIAGVTVKPKGIAALAYKASLVAGDIPNLAWSKITSGKPTTLSGYGITDAKIASGIITLGSNTITPVTSVNGHTGSVVNVTAGDLGLSSALRYIGKTTSTMSESFTGVPAGISGYTKPIVGDVVLDSAGNGEYVCVAVNGSTYTWESLGSESSFKKVQTAVSSPSAGDSAQIEFINTISQDAQGVISATKQPVRVASKTQTGVIQITKDNANLFLNTLDTGSSVPTDNDYYISQYVGGGTTTTTYHRRPVSALYSYIKSKTDTLYPTKAGGGATGTWGISISGNAATATTATKFASAQSVTLTGDTTGTKSSQAGWSIPTITSKMSGLGRKTTAESIAINQTTDIGGRLAWNIYDSSSRNADAENTPSFDASVINVPWDWGAYNGQIAISSTSGTTPRIQIRTANSKDNGDGANPRYTPLYTAWREIVTIPKDSVVGGNTQPIYINNVGQVVPGTALGTAAYNATEDFAASGHNHDSSYLKLTGGTMSGNILGNATATLGSTTNPWHQLVLGGATSATVTSASTNPRITFQESNNGSQPVHLIYSDYDSYRSPAGLKVVGGTSATPAWFEVEGNIYAAAFKGNADTATTATNLASKPSLAVSDTTKITVTAGGKTSDAFTVPYATTATSAGKWTTARTLTIGNSGKSVDGSGDVSWTLTEIGAAPAVTGGYLPLSGGTLTGAINTANGTWNKIGDDIQIGDINKAGHLGIKGINGNTGIFFTTYGQPANATGGAITWDGTKFSISSTTPINATVASAASLTSSAAPTITKTGTSTIDLTANTTYTLTVGGQSVIFKTPADDNSHYTTHLYAGGSSATGNAEVTSGNVYIRLFDNTTHRNSIQLSPGSNMSITSNDEGVITFTSIDKSHKSGSWNGLKYTATAIGGADELSFTLPTGTGATQVALGNHNHDSVYVKKADGVTAVTWDSTYKKITRTINGTTADVVAFEGTAPITVTGAANKLTIAHSGNSGYKHIPSGGSSGQFLGWDSDGTAKWVANPNTDTKVTSVVNHYTPAADTNAELTAAISGTAGTYAKDATYTVITGIKAQRDAKGHVTGITYTAQNIKDTNTTYTFTNKAASLSWGATTTIATVGGTDITVGLPANPNSDTKVTNTLTTTTKYYVTGTTSTTTNTGGQSFDTGVYVTTTAGEFSAVRHSYNTAGAERAYTYYNATDNSIDFIFV